MDLDVRFREERAELDAVLASKAFTRSPNISQILRYVCDSHFDGRSAEIKEYSIAIEALGPLPEFDQTRSSIVRVEAYNLRKRLRDYYAGEGASHRIRITVPPGTYLPVFERVSKPSRSSQALELRPENDVVPGAAELPPKKHRNRWRVGLGALAVLLLIILITWLNRRAPEAASPGMGPLMAAVIDRNQSDEIRILAGSDTPYRDVSGNMWSADRYFSGGEARENAPRAIAYADDPALYFHSRRGIFAYRIPLKKQTYELHLYFVEMHLGGAGAPDGGEGNRIFDVHLNGRPLLERFDVVADARGNNVADIKVFTGVEPGPNGMLELQFSGNFRGSPFLNALELLPVPDGRMRPIRIIARPSDYIDQQGNRWLSDRFSRGGSYVQRTDAIPGTADAPLFRSEKFGNFSYAIPVARERRYRVTLGFCENWFGRGRPGGRGEDARLFNVFLNGRVLMSRFDIYKKAGALHPLTMTFHGLTPNAQGKLGFDFVPETEYALVNSIEITDEGSN